VAPHLRRNTRETHFLQGLRRRCRRAVSFGQSSLSCRHGRKQKRPGPRWHPAGCSCHHVVRSSAEPLHRRTRQFLITFSVDRGRVGVLVTQQGSSGVNPHLSPYSGRGGMPKSVRAPSVDLGKVARPMDRAPIACDPVTVTRYAGFPTLPLLGLDPARGHGVPTLPHFCRYSNRVSRSIGFCRLMHSIPSEFRPA
jgi:hypothetical protein